MLSQTQILPFKLLFCVSDSIYPEVSAAEGPAIRVHSSASTEIPTTQLNTQTCQNRWCRMDREHVLLFKDSQRLRIGAENPGVEVIQLS